MEVTALGATGFLLLLGIINADDAISGFSNRAVITIGAMFILSRALVKTGFLEVVTDYFYNIGGNWKWFSFTIFFIAVSLSGTCLAR